MEEESISLPVNLITDVLNVITRTHALLISQDISVHHISMSDKISLSPLTHNVGATSEKLQIAIEKELKQQEKNQELKDIEKIIADFDPNSELEKLLENEDE